MIDYELNRWEVERLWQAGLHVMGKNLYEIMASYWPTSKESPAAPMNEIPKVVFSKTLKASSWGPARIVAGDIADEIPRLKEQYKKDIFAHGGASIAQSLAGQNLIDEYRLLIHPVALGNGFPSGVVALIYLRA